MEYNSVVVEECINKLNESKNKISNSLSNINTQMLSISHDWEGVAGDNYYTKYKKISNTYNSYENSLNNIIKYIKKKSDELKILEEKTTSSLDKFIS